VFIVLRAGRASFSVPLVGGLRPLPVAEGDWQPGFMW
jgi:hypothetical protein